MPHFLKMMIWLTVMAVIGLAAFLFANAYSAQNPDSSSAIEQVVPGLTPSAPVGK